MGAVESAPAHRSVGAPLAVCCDCRSSTEGGNAWGTAYRGFLRGMGLLSVIIFTPNPLSSPKKVTGRQQAFCLTFTECEN